MKNNMMKVETPLMQNLEVVEEEVENAEVVITTLNDLPGSWDSFIRGMCARRK